MEISLPEQAKIVLNRFEENGYEAYAVGGCVRDSLLSKRPLDWDITTNALPQETEKVFGDFRIIETGLKHGTVTVIVDSMQIEITTFRIDGKYSDSRRPDSVVFTRNLKDDLCRRDFTVNALAYNPKSGIADCFGGKEDLDKRMIRCVGDPDRRFGEDALRILRALRFASVLGFEIEEKTADSIHRNRDLLKNIASERIAAEFNKLLCGINVENILLGYSDVIAVFIPEIGPMIGFNQRNPHHIYDVWTHTVKAVSASEDNLDVRLTMFFHDMGKPHVFTVDNRGIGHFYTHPKISAKLARQVLSRLKYDNDTIKRIDSLTFYHDVQIVPDKKRVLKWLGRLGEDDFRLLLEIKRADAIGQGPQSAGKLEYISELEKILNEVIEEKLCFSLKDLNINGNDLQRLGIPKGKEIGEILGKLLDDVMCGRCVNDRGSLLSKAKDYMDINFTKG